MKICIVYDCLFPWTVGGAERYYRNLAQGLAECGHEVTYLTLRQWDAGHPPSIESLHVIPVGPRMNLYVNGKRRLLPPILFGIGVMLHLLMKGRRYDRIHTASFPYFPLLAIGLLRPWHRCRIAVDWHEVWTRQYWRSYLGALGVVGWWVQKRCARFPQDAYSFSKLHVGRLHELGVTGRVTRLEGEYVASGNESSPVPASVPPRVVYAGRMIPEKRVRLLVDALALAMDQLPLLQATLFGRGPEHDAVKARVAAWGLTERISLPGFVEETELDVALRTATVLVQPSEREGYGLVVVESAARGVPVVVVAGPDNAATELVEPGRNGYVVEQPTPEALSVAILSACREGESLRRSTRDWYAENARRLALDHSLRQVLADLDPAARRRATPSRDEGGAE